MTPGWGSEQTAPPPAAPPQARVHFVGGRTLDVCEAYDALRRLTCGEGPAGISHVRDANGRLLEAVLHARNGKPLSVNWTTVAYVEAAPC